MSSSPALLTAELSVTEMLSKTQLFKQKQIFHVDGGLEEEEVRKMDLHLSGDLHEYSEGFFVVRKVIKYRDFVLGKKQKRKGSQKMYCNNV